MLTCSTILYPPHVKALEAKMLYPLHNFCAMFQKLFVKIKEEQADH
jgi:hypothetical protein